VPEGRPQVRGLGGWDAGSGKAARRGCRTMATSGTPARRLLLAARGGVDCTAGAEQTCRRGEKCGEKRDERDRSKTDHCR